MPTYDYRCNSCKHEFEEIQRFSEPTLVKCPSCGANALVRIIGGAGLVFKGSGFYLTDYKNKQSSPVESKSKEKADVSSGEKKSESGASEKSESKSPAPKSTETASATNTSGDSSARSEKSTTGETSSQSGKKPSKGKEE